VIPKSCKRLAEVDFPIAVVSRHSAREKSIRHGHPSTLHLWWARRPLAACRAMLLGLLLPDPCDEHCPAEFKKNARALLPRVQGDPGPKDIDLRNALLRFIGDFANWDLAANPRYLEVGRGLVKAAHGEETPLVVDPFAGGGSIPLEALRLGCDAFASDLNPVACLILKVMLEDIPRHGPELADELRKVGAEIKKQAEKELAQYYPPDPDGATPIAYLWARMVRCESPNCGAEIPLLRSFWLSRRMSHRYALKLSVTRPTGANAPSVAIEVWHPEPSDTVGRGTISGGKAVCPACQRALARDRIEAQLKAAKGGSTSARIAAVAFRTGDGIEFRNPTSEDLKALDAVANRERELSVGSGENGLSTIPDEPLNPVRPSPNARGVSAVTRYGMATFADCFNKRQRIALAAFGDRIRAEILASKHPSLSRCLLLLLGRCVDRWTACCRLDSSRNTVTGSFSKQALQMVWDFCEANPFSELSGGFDNALEWVCKVMDQLQRSLPHTGQVELSDATNLPLPDAAAQIIFTDPPYYDSVPYADLSDFFYVWLKRVDPSNLLLHDPFDATNPLTPKLQECVWNQSYVVDGKAKSPAFFESRMSEAFHEVQRVLCDPGLACIVFAHKSTEGWEALLSGIVNSRLTITASWPIQTEMKSRTAARDAASLMGSVHLICRPRPEDAPVGDWGDVLRELPVRIGDWMEHLSTEGVRGADLVFACIGPAMEIYSRHSKVEDAEGREIPLGGDPEASEPHKRGFLAYVWEIVGRTALGQVLGTAEARARNGAAGALEEDARLTALFLWTLQATRPVHNAMISYSGTMTHGGSPTADIKVEEESENNGDDENDKGTSSSKQGLTLIYDVVRRFSQPLGIHLENWNERIISTEKGIVRLLPITERGEHLLGEDGATGIADVIERTRGGPINYQFAFAEDAAKKTAPATDGKGRKRRTAKSSDEAPTMQPGTTTLDRVHIAMLLQSAGKSNALRTMLKAETDRAPDFLRLANALSALYPKDSEEKRLLDAMLLAAPR
jgi:putative DNA methylase